MEYTKRPADCPAGQHQIKCAFGNCRVYLALVFTRSRMTSRPPRSSRNKSQMQIDWVCSTSAQNNDVEKHIIPSVSHISEHTHLYPVASGAAYVRSGADHGKRQSDVDRQPARSVPSASSPAPIAFRLTSVPFPGHLCTTLCPNNRRLCSPRIHKCKQHLAIQAKIDAHEIAGASEGAFADIDGGGGDV